MEEIIKTLTEAFSPSGRESRVRRIIIDLIKPYVDGVEVDKVGNVIAHKGDGGRPIIFVAHMDEIGVVITSEIEKGFYRIEPIGGLSPYAALNRKFILEDGKIGVVHYEKETLEDAAKNLKNLSYDKLYIDTFGETVKLGTFGVYKSYFSKTGKFLISKAMDDRIGCSILIEIAKSLESPKRRVYFGFSIQEEVGLVGSSVIAFPLDVEEAIAVDVTDSADVPKGLKRHSMKLGKGPALKIKDKASISDKKILEKLEKVAKEKGIPHQYEVLTIGGTDAAALMRTREGVPSATVSIPTRYIHTPNEVVHIDDVENTVKLLVEYIQAV